MSFDFKQFSDKYWWVLDILFLYVLPFGLGRIFAVELKLETILSFLTISTGASAILALAFTAQQLQQQRNQHKAEMEWQRTQYKAEMEWQKTLLAQDYMRRYNNPEFNKSIPKVLKILKEIPDDKIANGIKWKALEEGTEERGNLTLLLNFFDEMGIMYNRNLVNREIIKEFFRTMSLIHYKRAKKFIGKLREQEKKPHVYKDWETMNKDFE